MNRYIVFWLRMAVCILGMGAMCQRQPVQPVPIVDAGPAPSAVVDAGPVPSAVVDAGPAPSVVIDAGPAPSVEPDWLECKPEGFKAAPPVKRKLGARLLPRAHAMLSPPVIVFAARSTFFEPLNTVPLDQLRGCCVGYSACECLSTLPFGLKSTTQRGDDLYHWATVLDNFSGPTTGIWPPDDTGSDCESGAKAAMKLGFIVGYDVAYTLADIKSHLTMGPGVFCSNWSTSQYYTDRCGLTHYDPLHIEGGHARALVGQSVPLGRVAERNTWGKAYGVNRHGASGYFQESYDDIQRELDDGGVAVFYRVP